MCPDYTRHRSTIPPIRQTAKYHLVWRDITTYEGEYKRKNQPKATITINSLNRPPGKKSFRTRTGEQQFTLTKLKKIKRKVIIVAKTKKRTKAVEADELEELEGLEDLDEELEELDEVVDEADEDDDELEDDNEDDDEDEDDDEEDEEPAPKKSKKSSKSTAKKKAAKSGVNTAEVAEHFGVDGRTLRMVLRKHGIEKDENKRYEWSSLKHPEVIKIGKLLAKGEATAAKKEKLDALKDKKTSKTSTKAKKRKKVEVDEDDE